MQLAMKSRISPLLAKAKIPAIAESVSAAEVKEAFRQAVGLFEDQVLIRRGLASPGTGRHILFSGTDTGAGIALLPIIKRAHVDPVVGAISFFGGGLALQLLQDAGVMDGFERINPPGLPLFSKLDAAITGWNDLPAVDTVLTSIGVRETDKIFKILLA